MFTWNQYLAEVNKTNYEFIHIFWYAFVYLSGALPKEQHRFREVDKDFRDIMSDIASNPRLVVLAQRKDLSNLLKSMLDQLARCQKALNELLEVRKKD